MAKETASAIEFVSSFSMMGTIEKMATFNSKGGGLVVTLQTAENDKAVDILAAKGNVLKITIEVSKHKVIEPGDDPQGEGLDFDDISAEEGDE